MRRRGYEPSSRHAQWIANYIVSQTFPALAGISLGLAYGTYALMAVLSLVFVLAKVRETRGLEFGRDDVDACGDLSRSGAIPRAVAGTSSADCRAPVIGVPSITGFLSPS
jgi:hypothetical protein